MLPQTATVSTEGAADDSVQLGQWKSAISFDVAIASVNHCSSSVALQYTVHSPQIHPQPLVIEANKYPNLLSLWPTNIHNLLSLRPTNIHNLLSLRRNYLSSISTTMVKKKTETRTIDPFYYKALFEKVEQEEYDASQTSLEVKFVDSNGQQVKKTCNYIKECVIQHDCCGTSRLHRIKRKDTKDGAEEVEVKIVVAYPFPTHPAEYKKLLQMVMSLALEFLKDNPDKRNHRALLPYLHNKIILSKEQLMELIGENSSSKAMRALLKLARRKYSNVVFLLLSIIFVVSLTTCLIVQRKICHRK
jgi:hypothetical protein